MDQALAAEELERPIDRRRCHAPRTFGKLIEDLIGADRRVAAPDQLQHLRAQFRQTCAATGAQIVRLADRGVDAMAMIVRLGDKRVGSFNGRHRRDLPAERAPVERPPQEIARAVWPGQ